jgi:hypothetical protein
MSLGSGYDMVLLPPHDDAEPRSDPIPPQPVRGRRSGHHAGEPGVAIKGLESLTLVPRQGPIRPSPRISLTILPILLAHEALGEGHVEHQA